MTSIAFTFICPKRNGKNRLILPRRLARWSTSTWKICWRKWTTFRIRVDEKSRINDGQIVAVVVSPGIGFDKIFGNKAVALVSGGQTKNPSTADFLAAFEDLPTDRAIILPNNKNIQLAAQQAAEATVKKVKSDPHSHRAARHRRHAFLSCRW